MDFPLPVRSVSSVDYFTPLHVDTNIEYSLDMGIFPEINDPLHHWEPALVVASQSYATADPLETRSLSTSSEQDQSELDDLIDTYDIGDLEMDRMGFGFVDLPSSSLQSLLDSAESLLESSLSQGLELRDSVLPATNPQCEGLYLPEDSVEYFHRPSGQSQRKLEDAFSSTSVERGIFRKERLDIEEQCAIEYQIPLTERHGLLDFRHTSPSDTGLRQW